VSARPFPDKFKVAFSFAGEQRDLVRSVAEAVEKELGRATVFFDEWYEPHLAGHGADLKLQKIYGQQCDLVIICVSSQYGAKLWTLAEYDSVRARLMQARVSKDERDMMRILPIRVGDGDVEGIPCNAIVPDVRTKSAAQTAELVINRLGLIIPLPGTQTTVRPDWPEQPPSLVWPIADHSEARAAFGELLTRDAPKRFLPIRGPSETGKSQITRQMLGNALRMKEIACGRFDFKGTSGLDNEVRSFIQHLGVPLPDAGSPLSQRLSQILESVKARAQPTLLIFDTYEAAGEAQNWVKEELLPNLIRAKWLRLVVAGQTLPECAGSMLGPDAFPAVTLQVPPPTDWLDYSKPHRPELTLADVETACRLARNRAATLAQLLGPPT